jgi:hypothetical protein
VVVKFEEWLEYLGQRTTSSVDQEDTK